MRHYASNKAQPARRRRRRQGFVRTGLASLLLGLGALISNLGYLCASDTAVRNWAAALQHMRNSPLTARMPEWERRLLHIGPSIVMGIFGALALLWTLLLFGGALVWLILEGYGFVLLLGTVLVGVFVGLRRARLEQQLPRQKHLN